MLSALKVPERGGETQLADARAGYDSLSDQMREFIADLGAYHSTEFSQANDLGDFPRREKNSIYHGEAYFRPLVKVHPETGRKCLFIGRHAFGIPGMVRDQSRELLNTLLQAIVSDESHVYTHDWQVGDLLVIMSHSKQLQLQCALMGARALVATQRATSARRARQVRGAGGRRVRRDVRSDRRAHAVAAVASASAASALPTDP